MPYLPVNLVPSGNPFPLPSPEDDVVYKWVNSLGGAELPGPLERGDLRPDGEPAVVGIATIGDNNVVTIEYHK